MNVVYNQVQTQFTYLSGFTTMLLLELVLPFSGLLPVYSLPSFDVCLRKPTTIESCEILPGSANRFCE